MSDKKIICEYQAKSPKGDYHCLHDDHVDWKMPGGCKEELCPIKKEMFHNENSK